MLRRPPVAGRLSRPARQRDRRTARSASTLNAQDRRLAIRPAGSRPFQGPPSPLTGPSLSRRLAQDHRTDTVGRPRATPRTPAVADDRSGVGYSVHEPHPTMKHHHRSREPLEREPSHGQATPLPPEGAFLGPPAVGPAAGNPGPKPGGSGPRPRPGGGPDRVGRRRAGRKGTGPRAA